MQGHAESITAAAFMACSTAGFSIVGLGNGRKRPVFTWTATTSRASFGCHRSPWRVIWVSERLS
jgi:hypothetical protein